MHLNTYNNLDTLFIITFNQSGIDLWDPTIVVQGTVRFTNSFELSSIHVFKPS